jgi:hypothetical protein
MLWMEKWKWKKLRIRAWWVIYYGWKDRASLTPPWIVLVIKSLSKSLVGEHWWRRQSLAKKYTVTMQSWKRSKTLWMGHGAWMGIAWENMEDGRMGLKHNSENVTCFSGICFKGLDCPIIKTCIG